MAIDPSIILRGRGVDVGSAIKQGFQLGQDIRQAPLQNQLLQQKVAAGEQAFATGEQQQEIRAQQLQQDRLDRQLFGANKAIAAFDKKDFAGVLDSIKESFPDNPERQAAEIAEFQDNPQLYISQAQDDVAAFQAQSVSAQAKTQFGAQSTFKDSEGTLFFGTTKRNPNTGEIQSVLAPIDGTDRRPVGEIQQTGAFGQTAVESTRKKVEEAGQIVEAVGAAEVETPLGKIKLDETTARSQSDKLDIIDAKNTRRKEAEGATATINDLLVGDKFSKAFGRVVSVTPGILQSQEAIDAKASLDQVIGLLSLESRQKLKGQGTISEGEANTLAKSATTLANPLISDKAARKELRKVRNIFEDAAERNQLNRRTIEDQEKDQSAAGQQAGPASVGVKFLGFE